MVRLTAGPECQTPYWLAVGTQAMKARPPRFLAWSSACICVTCAHPFHVLFTLTFCKGLIALHALAKAQVSFLEALGEKLECHVHHMQARWGTNGLARQHYGTRHPGPITWSWRDSALSSTQIGRSWSLSRPSANRMWRVEASQRMMGRQRFLFHSCNRCGCQMSGHVRVENASSAEA
jgi:hypothetical protein